MEAFEDAKEVVSKSRSILKGVLVWKFVGIRLAELHFRTGSIF